MTSFAATHQPISVQQASASSIKAPALPENAHSVSHERICRVSSIDQEYPSLSLTRRNWLSCGEGMASGIAYLLQVTGA